MSRSLPPGFGGDPPARQPWAAAAARSSAFFSTRRMSPWTLAALALMAKLIASLISSSLAPAFLAPARSRGAQVVFPTARFATR